MVLVLISNILQILFNEFTSNVSGLNCIFLQLYFCSINSLIKANSYLPSNLAVLETNVLRSSPILSAMILSNSCRLWVLSLCSMSCEQHVKPCGHIRKCSPGIERKSMRDVFLVWQKCMYSGSRIIRTKIYVRKFSCKLS